MLSSQVCHNYRTRFYEHYKSGVFTGTIADVRPVPAYRKRAQKLSDRLYRYETNVPSYGWVAFWFEATFELDPTTNGADQFPVTSETFMAPQERNYAYSINTEEFLVLCNSGNIKGYL